MPMLTDMENRGQCLHPRPGCSWGAQWLDTSPEDTSHPPGQVGQSAQLQ